MIDKELDIEPIKQRLQKATPGPWSWKEDLFRPKYMVQTKKGDWKAKPGQKSGSSWVMLLTGPMRPSLDRHRFNQEDILHGYPDEWDFPHIIAIRWEQIRGNSLFNATPNDYDAALIAHAPSDLQDLINEVERLRKELLLKSL